MESIGLAELPTPEIAALIAGKVAALRTEAGLAAILDGIGDGFYAVDKDWRIILFNGEAARHFGRPPEEMLGRILWDAVPKSRETALGQLFLKVMASRETVHSETESIVFGQRWLAYRLFPLGDGMGVVFRDMTERKRAEMQRDLLTKEMEHRVKNIIALVQSLAAQTFRHSGVDPSVQRDFEARLITLSNIHGVLTQQNWDGARLHDVIGAAVRPYGAPEHQRFAIEGPDLRLGPQGAVTFSMALHELCTNAAKYGALAADAGRVDIRWAVEGDRFRWRWQERGGAPVTPPQRRGFGTRMIERALAAQLSGTATIEYLPEGVACTIDAPMAAIRENAGG